MGLYSQDKADSSIHEPHESWTVNKKVDENGNIISYDSTYTWSYSSGSMENMDIDSIMKHHQLFFNDFSDFFNHGFPSSGMSDSAFFQEFFGHSQTNSGLISPFGNMGPGFQNADSLLNEMLRSDPLFNKLFEDLFYYNTPKN